MLNLRCKYKKGSTAAAAVVVVVVVVVDYSVGLCCWHDFIL